jgi:hypothetical protein
MPRADGGCERHLLLALQNSLRPEPINRYRSCAGISWCQREFARLQHRDARPKLQIAGQIKIGRAKSFKNGINFAWRMAIAPEIDCRRSSCEPKGVRNDGNEKLIMVDESGLNPLA